MAEVRGRLRAVLPDAAVPARLVAVGALPRNASGKLDRAALPCLVRDSQDAAPGADPGRGDGVAAEIEELWHRALPEVAGAGRVEGSESFFAAGGDSARLMALAAALKRRFQVEGPNGARRWPAFDAVAAAAERSFAELAELVLEWVEAGGGPEARLASELPLELPLELPAKRRRQGEAAEAGEGSSESPGPGSGQPWVGRAMVSAAPAFAGGHLQACVVWRADLTKCIDAAPLAVFPASGGQAPAIVVGSHSHVLGCFDGDSGTERWRVELSDRIEGSCAVDVETRRVFVGCYDGRLHCVALDSGAREWSTDVALPDDEAKEIKGAPVVDQQAWAVLAGTHGGVVAAVAIEDGAVLFRLQVRGAVFASVALAREALYVCTTAGQR